MRNLMIKQRRNFTLCSILLTLLFAQSLSQICPQHCSECLNSSSCMKCEAGYYVDHNQLCAGCGYGCLICSNPTQCHFCSSGYQIQSNNCFRCADQHCISCPVAINACSSCVRGYNVNSSGGCTASLDLVPIILGFASFVVAAVLITFFCIRTNRRLSQDSEFEETTNEPARIGNVKGSYPNLLSEDLTKTDKNRGVYVSIMQNIGADNEGEQSPLAQIVEKKHSAPDSFMGSAPNPFGNDQLSRLRKGSNAKMSDEPSFPYTPALENGKGLREKLIDSNKLY